MELKFLGTGAGMPSTARNTSALALKLLDEIGQVWLFDCGEATQSQILKTNIRPRNIEKIFITHLHGDHIYGLPGLLSSRSFMLNEEDTQQTLTIYGPKGLKEWLDTTTRITGTLITYPIEIVEVAEGVIFEDAYFKVSAMTLKHTARCFGYRVEQKDLPGTLDIQKALALGVPKGPLLGQLKSGNDVTLENGTVVQASDIISESRKGFTVTILGDTRYCENAVKLAQDANVLVHESTCEYGNENKAMQQGHSTNYQAAIVAQSAGVDTLILNHISSRFVGDDVTKLELDTREFHKETYIAEDLMEFRWNQKEYKLYKH